MYKCMYLYTFTYIYIRIYIYIYIWKRPLMDRVSQRCLTPRVRDEFNTWCGKAG